MAKALTLADLGKKKPVSRTVDIFLDPGVGTAWREAQDKLALAEMAYRKDPSRGEARKSRADAQDAVDALQDDYNEHARSITLQSIGRAAYDAIVQECPATKEQERKFRKEMNDENAQLRYNVDTFPRMLLAASAVEPKLTREQVDAMFDGGAWNEGELTALVTVAMEINAISDAVRTSKDYARTRD